MGLVQQAVLDFDDEVQAPWRPRLVAVAAAGGSAAQEQAERERTRPRRPSSSGRSSSRVGVCRPVELSSPTPAVRGAASPFRGAPDGRHELSGRRPARSTTVRPSPARHLRLTRRARLLAAVLMLTVGVALGSWLGPFLAAGDGHLRMAGVQSVVVQPGDTLWSIASEVAGTADVRQVVDRIQTLNGLDGTVLVPGQVLELP